MLICLSCALTGAVVALDVLEFPTQQHVPVAFTCWRCPLCAAQGQY